MIQEFDTTPGGHNHYYTELLDKLKKRDPDAWDVVIINYSPQLLDAIRASLEKRDMPLDLVDDIAQETWLTAIRKFNDFVWEDRQRFEHWLRAISLNHIRTFRRKQAAHRFIDGKDDDEAEFLLERVLAVRELMVFGGIEEEVIWHEMLSALDKAMRRLKPREREMLTRWLMGETPRDLADVWNIKPRTVSMILLRARHKIETLLLDAFANGNDLHD